MVFPVWQSEASSSHQLAAQAGQLLGEPVTHTGTLDPMAAGVLVLLSGEDRFTKGALDWKKTYHFSILWGVATDSGDALGLITNHSSHLPDFARLSQVLSQFPHQYDQVIPSFSARRVAGKSAFDLAKRGTRVPSQTRSVQLSSISLDKHSVISATELLDTQNSRVTAVTGEFRQLEICKDWLQLRKAEKFVITAHTVETSVGTYIRQLTQDIATQLHIPATTWTITRTQNGPFIQEDCGEVSELATFCSQ